MVLNRTGAVKKVYIRKRSFFEIVFPLTIVFFVCISTQFVDKMAGSELRWVFVLLLFLYLLLNRKILVYVNHSYVVLLLFYFAWCISTTLWSEMPLLSFSKSTLFSFNIIIMLSAGSLWVIKYGHERSFDYLFLFLVVVILSEIYGGTGSKSITVISLYQGLSGNPDAFGSMIAMTSPLILMKLHQNWKKKFKLIFWIIVFIIDVHFLLLSFSRTALAIFLSTICFFMLSLPLSKKMLVSLSSFFIIVILVLMTPISYLEKIVALHIFKYNGATINQAPDNLLQSRETVWAKSYKEAKKGGIMGGGFFVNIRTRNFYYKNFTGSSKREKGNAQLAIVEETGLIGLCFYVVILVSFFWRAIPCYIRSTGSNKVAIGLVLGAIIGLLIQSIAEDSWDSAAGQEFIYFWTLAGLMHGMIYLEKRSKKLNKEDGVIFNDKKSQN